MQKLSVENKSSGEIELECSLDSDALSELAYSRLLVVQTALTVYIFRPILPSSTLSGKPIQWSTYSLPSDARRIISAAVSDQNIVSLATRNSINTLTLQKLPDHQFINALSACISLGLLESSDLDPRTDSIQAGWSLSVSSCELLQVQMTSIFIDIYMQG